MLKSIVIFCFKSTIWLAYRSYGIEGVNSLLLFMPAKLIPIVLKKYGATIGERPIIHAPLLIHNAKKNYNNLKIGNNCYIGRDVFFDLSEPITIQDNVTLSMRATLITHTDVGESEINKQFSPSSAPIYIGSHAYIGASSIVLQGVTLGDRSFVGAGSVVLKSVPPKTRVAGNPAKEI